MPELIDVLTLPFSPKIKPCPICNNPPEILRFDESDDGFSGVNFKIRCRPHQFTYSPMLCTPIHSDLDFVVQSWNRRVEIVMGELWKIKSNFDRDVQFFEDVNHKDFLNFLKEGNNGQ